MLINDLASVLAVKAMDGLFVRQAAIAHNIANANSPGFVPVRVRFEDSLRSAAARHAAASAMPITVAAGADAEPFRIDLEVTRASETALAYAALAGMLSRKVQIGMLAVNEGRPS